MNPDQAPVVDPRALAEQVMQEEQNRQSANAAEQFILPDDLLPGLSGEPMGFREALREGGPLMITLLTLLLVFESADQVAVQVLGPDIQETLDISDTVLTGIASLGGVVLVLATLPLAWLGDRFKRTRVVGSAGIVWAGFAALTGLAPNAFSMALTRSGTGLGASATIPISPTIIADQYPIAARTRMLAVEALGRPLGYVIGPFIAGFIAIQAGGDEGWRWAFILGAIFPVVIGLVLLTQRDPQRGRFEQEAILGQTLDVVDPPVRISAAFERLKKVKTFYYLVVGIGLLGFALVAVPVQLGLLLGDNPQQDEHFHYGYGAYTRGWMIGIMQIGQLIAIPIAGFVGDRIFRKDPTKSLRLTGIFVLLYGAFIVMGLRFSNITVLIVFIVIANAFQGAAFATIRPAIAAVVPYKMRAQAFAMVGVYIFLMGGFFGGLLAGAFSDAWGQVTALTIIVPPASLLGGLLIMYGAQFMKGDISLGVQELLEEQEERKRMAEDPEHIPVLQVRNLDAGYGPLQVLFDVEFEVQRGEVLALLGTNGAGKSTLLKTVSGLIMPDRGVVRFNGRTITLVAPEVRVAAGMVQVPGGDAIFPTMSVKENLDIWCELIEDPTKRQAARDRVYRVFPQIHERLEQRAGSLSGGQQQMLALSKALLLEPDILLIDELSLGLAPLVVQELLGVVERLKAEGMTMVIVEQSVNVALAVADRAIYMERGQVKFSGPARELLDHEELLHAVFLSGTGA
ncbi:MAG TPA: ATP-binding protein [Acidimicrobiales bacterium]|nr:ATP-binding protein [Acidimicrobiales bacterium]